MKAGVKSFRKARQDFLWVGNTPSLDFVNTAIVVQGRPVELLAAPGDLAQWLEFAGLLPAAVAARAATLATRALPGARAYRDNLRQAFARIAAGGRVPAELVDATNELLRRRAAAPQLAREGVRLVLGASWEIRTPPDLLTPVADSFARFITTADASRIRKCSNPECVLFFYDVSKSATRAWCSLDLCGNRLRVAAFRRRQARSASHP